MQDPSYSIKTTDHMNPPRKEKNSQDILLRQHLTGWIASICKSSPPRNKQKRNQLLQVCSRSLHNLWMFLDCKMFKDRKDDAISLVASTSCTPLYNSKLFKAGEKLETFAFPGGADQSAAQSLILINAFCSNKKIFLPESQSVLFLQVRRWVRTKVMLHPKEDQLEHLEEKKLRDLVKKQSEFVSYPISFRMEKASTKEVSDYEDEEVDKAGEKMLRKERSKMLIRRRRPRKPRSLVVVELGEAVSPLEHNPGEVFPQILQA